MHHISVMYSSCIWWPPAECKFSARVAYRLAVLESDCDCDHLPPTLCHLHFHELLTEARSIRRQVNLVALLASDRVDLRTQPGDLFIPAPRLGWDITDKT